MPSTSEALSPASRIALRTASTAIARVVRLEFFENSVSPTPTMQYLSLRLAMAELYRIRGGAWPPDRRVGGDSAALSSANASRLDGEQGPVHVTRARSREIRDRVRDRLDRHPRLRIDIRHRGAIGRRVHRARQHGVRRDAASLRLRRERLDEGDDGPLRDGVTDEAAARRH